MPMTIPTLQLTLHNSGQYLGFSVYQQACSALSDDYEGVRLAAIQLIWVLSHLYPERYCTLQYKQSILIEDTCISNTVYTVNVERTYIYFTLQNEE